MASLEEKAQAMYVALVTPHLFGILCGTLLSGIVICQLVEFFTTWENSSKRRTFDIWVASVIAVSGAALLALDWLVAYNTLISHRGDAMYPFIWRTPDYLQPPTIALSSAASQLWFMERAWRLTGSSFSFGLVAITLITLQVGAAFALLPIGVVYGRNPAFFCTLGTLLVIQNWAAAAVDLIATGVLVVKVKELVDAPFSRKSPITTLLRLTLVTGALTSVVAIAAGVLYETTWRYANYWIPFVLALPRLSSISCLVTINHRNKWREEISGAQQPPHLSHSSSAFLSPREREYKVESKVLGVPLLGKTDHTLEPESFHPLTHVSEIGSVGDLERALMEFGRSCLAGLDPEVHETVVGSVEALSKNGGPSWGHRRCSSGVTVGSGVTVATEVREEVEHRRSSSFWSA